MDIYLNIISSVCLPFKIFCLVLLLTFKSFFATIDCECVSVCVWYGVCVCACGCGSKGKYLYSPQTCVRSPEGKGCCETIDQGAAN